MKGGGEEVYEPRFTFHGFRYVEVTGYPGEPPPGAITGRVVHSATPPTGSFECSSPLVNELQENIVWGQRGNFLSVPTDCPQRDERLGWMGDAQVFVRTASFNMDVAAFFEKWMVDVEDAQSPEGAFPDVAPLLRGSELIDLRWGAPAWGDAGVIVPWTIYRTYGDTRIVERHYDAMARWMEYLHEANPDLIRKNRMGNNYGDWLSPKGDHTPKHLLATAYWAYDAKLMAEMAEATGRNEDARKYRDLNERIKAAFDEAYVSPDGRIEGDTQTCYLLALHMDLLPEELRSAAAEHLVRTIEREDWHLSTGFVRRRLPVPGPDGGRIHGRRLSPAGERDLPFVGVHHKERGHHDLGALGRLDGGERLPVAEHELLQPLLSGLGGRVAVPLRGGDRPRDAGLRPHRHPSASRRQPDPREGRVRFGPGQDLELLEDRGRPVRPGSAHPPQHHGHGPRAFHGRCLGGRQARA